MPNDQITPPDEDLLDRYFAGSLRTEERLRVEAYCAEHPRYARALDVLRATAVRAELVPSRSAGETLPALLERVDADVVPLVSRRRDVWNRRYFYGAFVGTVAATALIVVGLFHNHVPRSSEVAATNVYQTGTGQRTTIDLPDGSRIVLGPQTRLSLPEPFCATSRTISLVGQAQFDVAGDRAIPFVVNAGGVATRVLGTRFTVERYAGDSIATVQVMQGRVSTSAHDDSALLTPGMIGRFTDSTTVRVETQRVGDVASWVDGRLEFANVPVSTMLATLTRWYGYEFQLTDSTLAKRHITATFKVGDRDETLRLLKGLLGVSMTIRGATIILHPAAPVRPTRAPHFMPEGTMASAVTAGPEVTP